MIVKSVMVKGLCLKENWDGSSFSIGDEYITLESLLHEFVGKKITLIIKEHFQEEENEE